MELPLISVSEDHTEPLRSSLPSWREWWQERCPRSLAVLALTAFLVNCQPSEPYLTRFFKEEKGLSDPDLNRKVWPTNTYATFAFYLPAGMMAEQLGYKSTILLGLLFREGTRMVLVFGEGLRAAILSQLAYAVATNVNAVLFGYVFAVVEPEHAAFGSALVQGCYHAGNAVGSGLGQLLVSYGGWDDAHLVNLFYLSWAFTSLGLLVFLVGWPSARSSFRFETLAVEIRDHGVRSLGAKFSKELGSALARPWCLYFIAAVCSHFIFGNYFQTLVSDRRPKAPFGLLELGVEVAGLAGTGLVAWRLVDSAVHDSPWASAVSALCLYGAGLVVSTIPLIALLYGATIALPFLYGVGRTAAYACIGSATSSRYATVFTLLNFAGMAASVIVTEIVSALPNSTTVSYYHAAAGVCGAMLLMLVITRIVFPR